MPKSYSIVGIDDRKAEAFVAALKDGAVVTLVREPGNPFDALAVAVWIDGTHVGYIPKAQNKALALRIDDTGLDIPTPREGMLAFDTTSGGMISKALGGTFVRSPNSGYPMVSVSE